MWKDCILTWGMTAYEGFIRHVYSQQAEIALPVSLLSTKLRLTGHCLLISYWALNKLTDQY